MQKIYTKVVLFCLLTMFPLLSFTVVAQTVDLTTLDLLTTNMPAGTTITWHTAAVPTDANRIAAGNMPSDPTSVAAGATYYMAFHDVTNNCYSPTIAIPTFINSCPATTADLTTVIPTNLPPSTSLTWHTASPANSANLVSTPSAVGAGIYYSAFFDAVNDCYSPATPGIVSIGSCAEVLITQIYHSSTLGKVIEVTNVSNSFTTPANSVIVSLYSNTSGDQTGVIPTANYTIAGALTPGQSALIKAGSLSGVNIISSPVEETDAGITSFDGGDDIIIITTTTDTSAWANRVDVVESIENNTSYVRNDQVAGGNTTYTASEWIAFVDDNLDPDWIPANGGPERHPHDPLISEVNGANSDANNGLGLHNVNGTIRTGAAWSNGCPDRSRNVIVSENYSHSGASLSALNLTVDATFILEVTSELLVVTEDVIINGEINLNGTAQLVQTHAGASSCTGAGFLGIAQKGTANLYNYNYWSAPVNIGGSWQIGYIEDAAGVVGFTTAADANPETSPITLSSIWLYDFNAVSGEYAGWNALTTTSSLTPGRGYTMKGSGAGGSEQKYLFKGLPNDGDYAYTVTAGNDFLIGNPYSSAMDANKFIYDNLATIDGTLYFWEHFSANNSHNLSDYEGGYAVYNLLMSVAAVADDSGLTSGTGTASKPAPTKSIAVGQGFFVTIDTGGSLVFNNGQRIFETESPATSIFYRNNNLETTTTSSDDRMKIWFSFKHPAAYTRVIGLGYDANATQGYDKGYDGKIYDDLPNDMYWTLNDEKLIIQALSQFDETEEVPLGIKVTSEGTYVFGVDKMENVPSNINVYLKDSYSSTYYNITNNDVSIWLETGVDDNRFSIVFQESGTLGINDVEELDFFVSYDSQTSQLKLNNIKKVEDIESLVIYNLLGQEIIKWKTTDVKSDIINVSTFKDGVYLMKIETDNKKLITKFIKN